MTEPQATVFLWGLFELSLRMVVPFVGLLLIIKVLRIIRSAL